jgi:diacylglycerol kinase (ATP)
LFLRVAIILNGLSGKKRIFYSRLLPAIREHAMAEVFETQSETDAFTFSVKAVAENVDVIIAAGGDGTVNQVVNGMLQSALPAEKLPALTIIPAGSGNDFAKTVNITLAADALRNRLENFSPKLIDIGSVTFQRNGEEAHSYFLNVCSAGMGPEVLNHMRSGRKKLGAAVAYYIAILATFSTYTCRPVTIKTATWQWRGLLRSLAIGNGKYFGNGLCIAPDAKPDDGEFGAFICGAVSVFDFIRYTNTLKTGRRISSTKIEYQAARKLELTAELPCRIEADGELLGFLPATVNVIPQRVKFLY